MILHFNAKAVQALIAHSKASATHQALYGDESTAKPGLWLVGDDGVYLMSNGTGDDRPPVAYAAEVDPKTLDFDTWWSAKQASFGGDDGADFLDMADIEVAAASFGDRPLELDVSASQIAILRIPTKQ